TAVPAKAAEGSRTPGPVGHTRASRNSRSVLECGCPLPLSIEACQRMSNRPEPKSAETPVASRNSWAWPLAWIATIAIVVAGGLYVFKSCRDMPIETIEKTGKLARAVGKELAEVAAAFNKGTITTTFTSYATEMSGHQYLQVAELKQQERFTRTDEATTAFGYVPLPE